MLQDNIASIAYILNLNLFDLSLLVEDDFIMAYSTKDYMLLRQDII